MLIVQKFGGSSLKDPERLRHVAELVRKAHEQAELVVVVSAMGGTTDSLTGRAREMASAARGYFGLTQDQAAQYFGPLA